MAKKPTAKAVALTSVPTVIDDAAEAAVKAAAVSAPVSDVTEASPAADYAALMTLCKTIDPHFSGQSPQETTQQYLRRLVKMITSLPVPAEGEADPFDSLPMGIQDWYNDCINNYANAKPPKPEFPENLPGYEALVTSSDKAPPAPKGRAPKTPAGEKPAKPPAVAKEPRAPGVVVICRRLICENRTDTFETFKKKALAKDAGFKDSTLSSIYSDTHSTLKMLVELKMLPA
jgi:hypothetical protein